MTLCRKCGKEIPDGQEICEECQKAEVQIDEAYLDDLMQSMEEKLDEMQIMEETPAEVQEPVAEQLEQLLSEDMMLQESEGISTQPMDLGEFLPEDILAEEVPEEILPEPEEENQPEEVLEEILPEEVPEEILPQPEEIPEEIQPEPEEEIQPQEIQAAEVPQEEEMSSEEDINDLLEMLSQDYEDFVEPMAEEQPQEELAEEKLDDSPAEATLFREDDAEASIFADDMDSLSVDDIFDDALSAVDYSEAEEEPEEVLEEFLSPEEADAAEGLSDFGLDSLALDEGDLGLPDEEGAGADQLRMESETAGQKEKKESFWKRVFGNIITEQSAEEEAKEREQEQADAAEKAAAREEKKKQAEAEKAEKAEQVKAEKEQKKAEKAEQAAVKAAEKAEKKRLKAEMEAQEVVGRINPLGASIVMVFFGLLCVLIVVGSQALSYTSSVNRAESSFNERDYKEAYKSLAGVEVSEASQEMKEKVRICMQLQRQLEAYQNYYEMRMYLEALDSLMKGIRSYDANKTKADQYEMLGQYNELEGKLANQLYEEFGVSESQARSINAVETQEEYTSRLENIIAQWERRNREDEK